MQQNSFFKIVKLGIPKRFLLLVSGFVWTFAGLMLFTRGFWMMQQVGEFFILKFGLSLLGGILFYLLMFSKISMKHIIRIVSMTDDKPSVFSFFNLRSYLMMSLMMGLGIFLRSSGIVPLEYLSLFYIVMATPLSLSAFRFYYFMVFYKEALELVNCSFRKV